MPPAWILCVIRGQLSEFWLDARATTSAAPTLPSPLATPHRPMPAHHGVWLPRSRCGDANSATCGRMDDHSSRSARLQLRAASVPRQHLDLVPQRDVLERELASFPGDALTAASAYLKTSHIDASRHAGSVDCPLDHVKQNADPLMALHSHDPSIPVCNHE